MKWNLNEIIFSTANFLFNSLASSCPFCITKITTYNMETTIYWKSNFSHQNTSVNYVPQYNCDDSWISVPCPRPQWHKNSDEMSCVVLTCATTKIDEYCELRVEAHGNSSGNFVTPSALYDPTSESMSVCLFVCLSFGGRVIHWTEYRYQYTNSSSREFFF